MALIMSSHVAGSRVGGSAQALALTQFKIDPVVIPTVLYGRHPGWGAPGGAQVPIEAFEGMLDGVEANGLFGLCDLVLTGYFASVEQVRAAARAIDASLRLHHLSGLDPGGTSVVVTGQRVTVSLRRHVDYVFARGIPAWRAGTDVTTTVSADVLQR